MLTDCSNCQESYLRDLEKCPQCGHENQQFVGVDPADAFGDSTLFSTGTGVSLLGLTAVALLVGAAQFIALDRQSIRATVGRSFDWIVLVKTLSCLAVGAGSFLLFHKVDLDTLSGPWRLLVISFQIVGWLVVAWVVGWERFAELA